jgi:FG-GAP repeat
MRSATTLIPLVVALAACGYTRPANIATLGGHVRGLWNGSDGVTLRLQSTGIDALFTVTANGQFQFPDQLPEHTSYSISVTANPARHVCAVESGGNGVVGDTDVRNVAVTCTGPDVAISLSGPSDWTFNPLLEAQTFAASVVVQDVTLTITGVSLTAIKVDQLPLTSGQESAFILLPLGSITIPVEIVAFGTLSRTFQLTFERGIALLDQIVYGKAVNPGIGDAFSGSIAVSGDTLAVTSPGEDSSAIGINGDQGDNSAADAGAVYIFVRADTTWSQQAYIKASNTDAGDFFGSSIALFGDTLAVGAIKEASNATGVGGNQADNSAVGAGAVYVFVRSGSTWTQQAYIKATDTGPKRQFGTAVALSGDLLAVAGNQTDIAEGIAAKVYFYGRTGVNWTPQGILRSPSELHGDYIDIFRTTISLFGDTLAVAAQEVNRFSGASGRGSVYVFTRSGTSWVQETYLTASETGTPDRFGASVSVTSQSAAVGAPLEVQGDTSGAPASFVHIYARVGSSWIKQAQVSGSNTTAEDDFGAAVVLSRDTLAVGAPLEGSTATGVNGNQGDGATNSGAVYVFSRSGSEWVQRAYVKASNAAAHDQFGHAVGLSNRTLVVGAFAEDGGRGGVNVPGAQADDSAPSAGAAYIFR